MELSSVWYNSFWCIINQIALLIALVASDKVGLPNNFILRDYKGLVYVPSYLSSTFAFFVRPLMEPDLTNGRIVINHLSHFLNHLLLVLLAPVYPMWFLRYQRLTIFIQVFFPLLILVLLPILFYFLFLRYRKCKEMGKFFTGFAGPFLIYPSHTLCLALFTASLFAATCVNSCSDSCKPVEIILLAHWFGSCLVFALFIVRMHINRYVSHLRSYEFGYVNMIEISLGWMGYILAQYCIQEKSVSLLVMVSALAVSWLGNVAMVQPRTDFGIFHFLIGAVLDCAISLFGLGKLTWICLGGCVFLVHLQHKLKSVSLRYPRARTSIMNSWRSLEEKIRKSPRPALSRFHRAKQM